MGKFITSYIVILCLLLNSCVYSDTLSSTSVLSKDKFRALIHNLAEDLRYNRLPPGEVIRIAEERIASLSQYPGLEPYIRALRRIIKIAEKKVRSGQESPKAVIASIREFFDEEYQAGGAKSSIYENQIAPFLEEYGLSFGLRILKLLGIISNDVKDNILRKIKQSENLGLLKYIFLMGFRTIPILIGITSILFGLPPVMIAAELMTLTAIFTILSMMSHKIGPSMFGASLVGIGIFYLFSIQALYSYLGIPLIVPIPFIVHSAIWNQLMAGMVIPFIVQFFSDHSITGTELKAMSTLMHSEDEPHAYFCEMPDSEIDPQIKWILEKCPDRYRFIEGESTEGLKGELQVKDAHIQAIILARDSLIEEYPVLKDYKPVVLKGVGFSGHGSEKRGGRVYIPFEILEATDTEAPEFRIQLLKGFIEHECLHAKGWDPCVYEKAGKLYREYIAKKLAEAGEDSPLLKAKLDDILRRVQAGESIKLSETQLHRLLWLIDRSKEVDLVLEIAGLLNLIIEPDYKGDAGHVIMAIEKEILEILNASRERAEELIRDRQMVERIAARLISYVVDGRKNVSLRELLGYLKETLELEGLDEALKQRGSLEDFRKGRLGDILIEFFRRIPKADIHHHLDGSISPRLAFRVLQKYPRLMELYGNLKSPEDLRPYIEFSYRGEGKIDLDALWKKFELFTNILNTGLDAVTYVFRESSLEDFHNDGLTLIEQKVSIVTPGQNPGIEPAKVLEAAVRGLIEAEEATGGKLQTGLIPCIWKDPQHILGSRYAEVAEKAKSDPEIIIREAREEALRQVKIVVDLKKRWEREKPEYAPYLIGIDTVGDEKDYIREITEPALRYAAENGLRITEHLGENWNPGELKQALSRLRQGIESGIVKRIGHATALGIDTEDVEIRRMQEEIKGLIREKNIHIETCPSSNKLMAPEKAIPGYQDHPVVRFYRELGNVSINTDDSWILHTRGLSGEFMKVWLANPELTFSDIQRIIENGFRASFIDKEKKTKARGINRIRQLIHDIRNVLYRVTADLDNLIDIGILKEEEFDMREIMKISTRYDSIRFAIGPLAAIDYFRESIPILQRFADQVAAGTKDLKEPSVFLTGLQTAIPQLKKLLDALGSAGKDNKEEKTDIIKTIRDNLRLTVPYVTLELDIQEGIPPFFVPANETDTLRVFWNMLGNSTRAMQKKIDKDTRFTGRIRVSARLDKDRLIITVADNGSGIAPEHLQIPEGKDRPWIFLSGSTTKTAEAGEHGLGLNYVWDTVVGKWNGRIDVESTVGEGTRFILEIPSHSPATNHFTPDAPALTGQHGEIVREIKARLQRLLDNLRDTNHENFVREVYWLLKHSFEISSSNSGFDPKTQGAPSFGEFLNGTILHETAKGLERRLSNNGSQRLATRGAIQEMARLAEEQLGELDETRRNELIDRLTEEFKEGFFTPLDEYSYHEEEKAEELARLKEAYPILKQRVQELNQWLREQGELLQVHLNMEHQGTYFDVANAISQGILFGKEPHMVYDLHDDNAPLSTGIGEGNWIGYATRSGLFSWAALVRLVRPPKPGTTAIMIHEVKGVTSVSICFDYFSYYGKPTMNKKICKDGLSFRPTIEEIEDMANQIIDGLMLDDLDVRLFSLAISPGYIWPDQAEIIVDKLIGGIKRYVTQRKEIDWHKKKLDELIPSPWNESDEEVVKFINDAITTESLEFNQLSDNELCRRLYYALEEPGIGLPDRPAPPNIWWKHVAAHLTGALRGQRIEGDEELQERLRPIRQRYKYITNLLQEWLRRKWSEEIGPRLDVALENILGIITPIELEDDVRFTSIKDKLAEEYNKSQGIRRILISMVMARLGINTGDLIVISGIKITKDIPNVVVWTSLDELKELVRKRKVERTLLILDEETRRTNFGDVEIGKEYNMPDLGRSFFVSIIPELDSLQLLCLVQEIFANDLNISPGLRKLLAGEDLSLIREVQPQKVLQDLEKAKDELIELIRSS